MTRREVTRTVRSFPFGAPLMDVERQAMQRIVDRQVRRADMTQHEKAARRSLLRVSMGYYGIVNPYVNAQALAARVAL